jgi:hypothetical protein
MQMCNTRGIHLRINVNFRAFENYLFEIGFNDCGG